MRTKGALATALGLCLLVTVQTQATVICVPNDAISGSCTGGAGQPNIQAGIDAANMLGGDTVLVGSGTYVEVVSGAHGGAAGLGGIDIDRPLTLKSLNGKGVTTITAVSGHCLPTSCPGGNIQLISLSASGVTIDGFTILTTGSTTNLITANGDAASDNHVIKNNTITNPAFDDGFAGGGWGILLGGTGVDGADNNLINNNEISLNPDPEKDLYTFGIGFLSGGADASDNNTMSNNFVHDAGGGGFTDVGDTNPTVTGNIFEDNARYGWVDFGSASGSTITGNTFTNNGRSGLEVRNGAQNATVSDNCFNLNGSSPASFDTTLYGGIRIDDDGNPGATVGTKIHGNNFNGDNVPNGVTDISSASTNSDNNANLDWWGCPGGPGFAGCDTVTLNVDYTPPLGAVAPGTPCSPTTTTTTTSTTTTTIAQHITRLSLRRQSPGAGNGSIRIAGDFVTPPPFLNPPFTVKVTDSLSLNQSHTWAGCTLTRAGYRCSDTVGSSRFKARFKPLRSTPSVFRYRIAFQHIAIDAPFAAPVFVEIDDDGVQRFGSISDCRTSSAGLNCRQF